MDRFLTVNDSSGRPHRNSTAADFVFRPSPDSNDPDDPNYQPVDQPPEPKPPASGALGPCLYLGPEGQRCARPATEGGFCDKHQPGATKPGANRRALPQIVGAGIGILAAAWPIVFDVVRAILHWLRRH
jgi:hypothetical protein